MALCVDRALCMAAREGDNEAVRTLLDAGADVHAWADAPLWEAAMRGHADTMRALLDAGADQDIALVGGAYHFVHGETPCWREVVSGAHGLHFCLGAATPSVHIDPTQIVSSKLLGTCVYDPSVTYQHWKDLGWVP